MKICAYINEKVGYLTLKELYKNKIFIPLVFTSSVNRKDKISDWLDFNRYKKEFKKTKFISIDNPNSKIVTKKIKDFKPDLIIVISWSQIISKKILNIPTCGVITSHYSKLPLRRGGAPLFWAIKDNLKYLGISIYYMEAGIDDGDIIKQTTIKINTDDDATKLMSKIYKRYPKFYSKTLMQVVKKKSKRVPQNHKFATYTKTRKPEDGLINFDQNFNEISRFIMALCPPYPCAYFQAIDSNGKNKKFKLLSSKKKDGKTILSGYLE
tara:strand:- start:35080 stop:35880 length:801 start_codon:yes stop_codon:yes gene_type:complete